MEYLLYDAIRAGPYSPGTSGCDKNKTDIETHIGSQRQGSQDVDKWLESRGGRRKRIAEGSQGDSHV